MNDGVYAKKNAVVTSNELIYAAKISVCSSATGLSLDINGVQGVKTLMAIMLAPIYAHWFTLLEPKSEAECPEMRV